MADLYSGLGGGFGGLTSGLQMIIALREAAADRALRERNTAVAERNSAQSIEESQAAEARRPYEDIQSQLNKQNITAALPDIQREYAPPQLADTFQPTQPFQPPAFGQGMPPARPRNEVGSLETSHMAQVLERANRESMHQRKTGTLQSVLTAAAQRAQATQLPQSGAFETPQGKAELPEGFSAQAEKTFTPYQYGGNGIANRRLERLATAIRLVRSRIPEQAIKLLDMGMKPGLVARNPLFRGAAADLRHLVELQNQYETELGGITNPGGDRGKTKDDVIDQLIRDHPDWTDEAIAAEADRRFVP